MKRSELNLNIPGDRVRRSTAKALALESLHGRPGRTSERTTMTSRYIFHLSIPVSDLASAKRFYVDVLNARTGRENAEWLDVLLWGHQITLQHRPMEVLPRDQQGKRHFGVVLPWPDWEREVARIGKAASAGSHGPAKIEGAGTDQEHGKLYLSDPSGNVIELKAYRNVEQTLGLPE